MARSKAPLSIEGLEKSFKTGFLNMRRVHAVRGLTLSLNEGEIFGLLGPNGAGKTTTLKMVTGLIFPDKGSVSLFGKPADSITARRRVGFLPENPWFYDYLSAREFLHMAAGIFGISRETAAKRVPELLDKLGITRAADLPLRKYSKGMLQRAGLAQALINDPDLVIMDEPLSGLDPIGRRELREIILALKKRGKTVLFSSHILSDVEEICDRVAIVAQGKLRSLGSMESLLAKGISGADLEVSGDEARVAAFAAGHELSSTRSMSGFRLSIPDDRDPHDLLAEAMKSGFTILELRRHRRSLEELFMETSEQSEKEVTQ